MHAEQKAIQQELHKLIATLDATADAIRHDFYGIGSEYCADSLQDVCKKYRELEKRLEASAVAGTKL